MKDWLHEYLRHWKLCSLGIGIALLVFGSLYYRVIDWDVTISFVMAVLTYLTAPWCFHAIISRKWSRMPWVVFFTWFSVDGCYSMYWYFKNPEALIMREANFYASLPLYGLCAIFWAYKGSLNALFLELKGLLLKR